MKHIRHWVIRRITSPLLIGAVIFYMYNFTLYIHRHIMDDGTVITHSHPYEKNDSQPFKSHHHSKSEFLILSSLEFLFIISVIRLALIAIKRGEKLIESTKSFRDLYFSGYNATRAPPASLLNI